MTTAVQNLERKINFNKVIAWVFVGMGFLVGFLGLFALPKSDTFSLDSLDKLGSFYQGTVASLWSLGALFFIYVAFLGQKQALLLQQEKLEMSRLELEEQRKQADAQNESIKRQNFETAFFQLLNLHNQNVAQMRYFIPIPPGNIHEARKCFEIWHQQLRLKYDTMIQQGAQVDKIMEVAYRDLYYEHRGELDHYFRTLYHVFKFVDDSLPDKDKRRYTSLARAQLSAYELALLFYNGLIIPVAEKEQKFNRLIVKFALLEQLDENLLLDRQHKAEYSKGAYEWNG